ncbi:MAG: hypothetical protein KAG97_13120, partial [Victivallales bacterium]|nr:hypothetical protein [Victivallales bacterium]
MTEKVRFLIVGASYAGSLLAAKLAGSGSTFIADRSLPGARMNCGGGVHAETFKRLEVEIPFVETDSILMSVLGKETSFPCRYVVIDRTLLNKALFDKAKAAGAEFALMSYSSRNESAKTAIFALPEGGEREITYEKIVFADGFHPKGCRIEQPPPMSPSNRNFPAGAAKARIIEGNTTRPNTLYFRITEDNPCGYSWLFPMPGG